MLGSSAQTQVILQVITYVHDPFLLQCVLSLLSVFHPQVIKANSRLQSTKQALELWTMASLAYQKRHIAVSEGPLILDC